MVFYNYRLPASSMYHHGLRSVYKLNAHVVVLVKYRRKAINAEILKTLQEIFTDTLKKCDCALVEFNGEADHIHLLIDYKPDKPLSTLIGNLKTVIPIHEIPDTNKADKIKSHPLIEATTESVSLSRI